MKNAALGFLGTLLLVLGVIAVKNAGESWIWQTLAWISFGLLLAARDGLTRWRKP